MSPRKEFTQTMRAGYRDLVFTFGARVVVVLLGLALQSCLAWFLEPTGRGSYAVCILFTMLLGVGCSFGVDAAGQYFVASKQLSLSEGLSVVALLEAAGAIVAFVIGFISMHMPLEFFAKSSTTAFVIAVLTVPPQMAFTSLLLLMTPPREFLLRAMAAVSQAGLRFGATLLFVWIIPWGVVGALLANLLASLLILPVYLALLNRRHPLKWVTPTWNTIRKTVGYGSRYYFAAFSTLVGAQIGVILMAFFSSQEDIGIFHASVTLATSVIVVSDVVGTVLHPRIAADPHGRPELTAQCTRLVAFVAFAVMLTLSLFATPIVSVVLSPKFLPAVPVIWILAPGVVWRTGTKTLIHYLNATNHPGIHSVSTCTTLVVNFALLLMLLPRMGLLGAAWAMSIGFLAGGTVLLVAFWQISGLSLRASWLPQRADLTLAMQVSRMLGMLPSQQVAASANINRIEEQE